MGVVLVKERKKVRKRADFNLLGRYLQRLYRELGISSDREVAQKAGIHQTTLSTIKRTRTPEVPTLLKIRDALRTYPGWRDEYTRDLFIAANRALPEEREQLAERLRK